MAQLLWDAGSRLRCEALWITRAMTRCALTGCRIALAALTVPGYAILDLSLGAGQPGGLQALHILRTTPATRDLPAIVNTNGLENHRDRR